MILSAVLGRLVLVATTTALARNERFDAAQGWLISDDLSESPVRRGTDLPLWRRLAAASPFDDYQNNKSRWVFSPR
jgi:hypothetical protein